MSIITIETEFNIACDTSNVEDLGIAQHGVNTTFIETNDALLV